MWLFIGRTISQLGTSITTFAIPWLLLQLTNSATQTALAFAVGYVPYLLFSLPAGVWADQYNRKKMMVFADSFRLILLLSIPITYLYNEQIPILLLFVVQAGVSIFSSIFDAAYGACLPSIVDRSQLHEGNSILQMGFSISRIGGPIIAGILISILGAANTIFFDVITYLISIITIFVIRSSFSVEIKAKTQTKMTTSVREGLQYVWNKKILRILALFTMLVNLVGPGIDIALLYRIKNELHFESNWAGIIMGGLSFGMVIGSFVMGKLKRRYSMGFLLTISTFGQVLPPILLIISNNPIVIVFTQFLVGLLLIVWNIQTVTLRQLMVPNYLLGRCVSLFRMIAWVTIPLGTAMAGIITEAFGASLYFFIACCDLVIVCIIFLITKLYRLDESDYHEEGSTLQKVSIKN